MDSMLHVGAKLEKETADNAAEAIERVLKTGFECHASDKVMLKALSALQSACTVSGVTIESCNLTSDDSKTVRIEVPSDFAVK